MINRRKMLGVAAGGAIAGPRILQQQANLGEAAMEKAPYPYAELQAKQAAQRVYTLENLAKLKRIASGDLRDEDRNYPTEGNPTPFGALKSVSEDARQFMRTRLYERQWQERTIKAALDALDHYDKTGILRTFF